MAFQTGVQKADASDDYSSYDSIVRELSSSSTRIRTDSPSDPEIVKIHAGIGIVTSQLRLDLPGTLPSAKTLQGIEVRLGIDLFDPNWIAEGAIRAFNPQPFANGEVGLREFDLLVKYRNALNHPIYFSIGAGMAARYLQFSDGIEGIANTRPSTPSTIVSAGFEAEIGQKFSAGIGLSYRSRMISETPDEQAFDGSLQLLGHF